MNNQHVMNTYNRFDIVLDHGEGTWVYDSKGEKYLDFVSGIAVNCLGHCHPAVIQAIGEQSKKLMHVSNLYWTENMMEFATGLAEASGLDKIFFNNSGTEANETALKIARKYGKVKGGNEKSTIIYMKESFHGRSMGALSVTGQEKYQEAFKPLIGGTCEAVFNDIESVRKVMDKNVCAVILEPVQGESGVLPATPEFLAEVRSLCDEYDALLIFDEVQCGMGRSGKMFAFQKLGTSPDILTTAKAIAAGFPMGAVMANNRAADHFVPGDHGCTFGGNPLGCAIGLTVLDQLLNKGVLQNVEDMNTYLMGKLNELKDKYDVIEDVRGIGLLIGVQFATGKKDTVAKYCKDNKLLLVGAGHEVIRFLPPLNVTIEEIDIALKIFEAAISK